MLILISILILILCFCILFYDYVRLHNSLERPVNMLYKHPYHGPTLEPNVHKRLNPKKNRRLKKTDCLDYNGRMMDDSPVPIEAHIVPTHASQTNKMNNMLGNVNSSQGVGPGLLEVVVPSDFYWSTKPPQKYRWPSGSILPDYIYE